MIPIEEDTTFTFSFQPTRVFDILSGGESGCGYRTYLEKWGLLPDTQLLCFRYDQFYHRGLAPSLLRSLFTSDVVREHFLLSNGRGALNCPIPHVANLKQGAIKFQELQCNETTLDMFQRLIDDGEIVRSIPAAETTTTADDRDDEGDSKQEEAPTAAAVSLRVCQMMDVYLPGGVTVSDQLRGVFMLGEESEHASLFSETERQDFLYHVMWRLCAGGALNQWEDDFSVYRDATRTLYKDLVCVGRKASSLDEESDDKSRHKTHWTEHEGGSSEQPVPQLQVMSHVLAVESIAGVPLFPRDDQVWPSNGNYLYVVVNPPRKEVVVWYHGFWSSF